MDYTKSIGGEGLHVEIDKSKFGKRKYNIGKIIGGLWVFGGFCTESEDIFMVPVKKCDREMLLKVIKEYIRPEITIISDCWKAYECLDKEGYQHLKVNQKYNFVDP